MEGNTHYTETQYNTEKELETLAVKNKYALFGENTICFDRKMLITSIAKISKIPDGLFLAIFRIDIQTFQINNSYCSNLLNMAVATTSVLLSVLNKLWNAILLKYHNT